MDYKNILQNEIERSGLDSVFGLSVVEANGEMVTIGAHGATWRVSGPALLKQWRGTRTGWALAPPRISWAMILADFEMAKAA